MKRRSARLRENLSLSESDKPHAEPARMETIDEAHIKQTIADLHDVVVSFVANPIFKNIAVVEPKTIYAATKDLNNLIDLSEELKREAKTLGKSAKK